MKLNNWNLTKNSTPGSANHIGTTFCTKINIIHSISKKRNNTKIIVVFQNLVEDLKSAEKIELDRLIIFWDENPRNYVLFFILLQMEI